MSTETPEKSVYQLRREAVARAIEVWQEEPDDVENTSTQPASPLTNAAELEDCLNDEGLILLPREMVAAAVVGDTAVHEDPVRIVPTVFMVATEDGDDAAWVRMVDEGGREVQVDLDGNTRRLLLSLLTRGGAEGETAPIVLERPAEPGKDIGGRAEAGVVVIDDECPACDVELHCSWTPDRARALAAHYAALADEADRLAAQAQKGGGDA